jgi:hypothetical protein
MAEAAVVLVAAVAQRQQAIGQVGQGGVAVEHPAHDATGAVGGIALAGGGDHEQGAFRRRQHVEFKVGEGDDARALPGLGQGAGGHQGQLLGEAGLAGIGDQGRVGTAAAESFRSGAVGAACAGTEDRRPPHRRSARRTTATAAAIQWTGSVVTSGSPSFGSSSSMAA